MKNVFLLHKKQLLSIWVYNNTSLIGLKTMYKFRWKPLFEHERQLILDRGGWPIFNDEDSHKSNPAKYVARYALFVEFGSQPFISQKLINTEAHSTLVIAMMPNAFGKPDGARITLYEHAHCKKEDQIHRLAKQLLESIKYRYAREKQKQKRDRQLTLV